MSSFEGDFGEALSELENLARVVPDAIPDAINAMSSVIIPKLRSAAPYDIKNSDGEHLRDLIGKNKVKTSTQGGQYQVIFVTKRGKKDKHIYKAVVAEYGRSGMTEENSVKKDGTPSKIPNPFWRRTVIGLREEAVRAGTDVIDNVVESIKSK